MKKLTFLVLTAIMAFLIASCEETVSPKAEFREQYILTCIVDVSSDSVIAILSKTYDVDGLKPEANRVDPAVTSAEITISEGPASFKFSEGERQRTDTSRYTNRQQYYCAKGVRFVGNKDLKIVAKLPNGKVLSSVTTPPPTPEIEFSYKFPNDMVDPTVNWFIAGDYYSASWYPVNKNHFTFPRLSIPYIKDTKSGRTSEQKEIPLYYVKQEGKLVPYYPGPNQTGYCSFEYNAMRTTFKNISEGSTEPTGYILRYIDFELLEFDAPLSTYYSSTKGVMDNFSIRAEEMVYSNISGGLGIFGSCRKTTVRKRLNPYYITSLGYKTVE
ncbi:MAG: DUF4249 family protein [Ignavibacteria bacterium]|jgi:hypothetical protein|nr:DUF4249 family protein [Ignavibacteria bacterium]MCU7502261.1 DUF4249 family protein [Ignavibacteria bacterium]MCU7516695.1 DUF4249 family protein [Ignavibacteria bacterium]